MISGFSKTLVRRLDGQSMVEFALILPLLVLIIAGLFDLGRAFFAYIVISNAAREGARYATLNADYMTGTCEAVKNEALTSGITIIDSNIIVTCGSPHTCPIAVGVGCAQKQPVIVKVGYDYNDMIFKFFFQSGIRLENQVEMIIP